MDARSHSTIYTVMQTLVMLPGELAQWVVAFLEAILTSDD